MFELQKTVVFCPKVVEYLNLNLIDCIGGNPRDLEQFVLIDIHQRDVSRCRQPKRLSPSSAVAVATPQGTVWKAVNSRNSPSLEFITRISKTTAILAVSLVELYQA